jgi:hypothetical protein
MKNIKEDDPLTAVLRELESTLAREEANHSHEEVRDMFISGCHAGYAGGLRRAINIVNYEIGIRQNPPNINYPGERPVPHPGGIRRPV